MAQLQSPEQKREIKIQYPAELYDQLVDGLAHRFGWREEGMPAQTPTAKLHASYNAANNTWKPTKQEFAIEMAVTVIWAQAMEGFAAKQAQAAQQSVQQQFQATLEEARTGGYLTVTTGAVA